MEVAKRLEGIGEYYFSQKLREIDSLNKAGKDVINLGIGSPDLSPHPSVIKVLVEETTKINNHGYQSYKGSPVLRSAMAKWYSEMYEVSLNADEEILPLIGSKEGIMHVCMTYLNPGDFVMIPNPGYPTYRSAATIAGASCMEYELMEANNWQPNFEVLENELKYKRVKLMFVNYPHMPTGQQANTNLFTALVEFAKRHGILIVHDNPYSFILNDHPQSMLAVANAKDHVIELNSLSKSHNMAGWRIGMLCGAKERINEVLRFKSNMDSGMFLPMQLAAAKALSLSSEWFESMNAVYRNRRDLVFELLELLECSFSKTQVGMFVWARIPPNFKDGYALSDKILYEANVFLTPGSIFGTAGEQYIRVSLCCKEEKIIEAIKRLKTIL